MPLSPPNTAESWGCPRPLVFHLVFPELEEGKGKGSEMLVQKGMGLVAP